MKLINASNSNNWVIVDEVSDGDAAVLRAVGFEFVYDVDEAGMNYEDDGIYPYEMWWNTALIEARDHVDYKC